MTPSTLLIANLKKEIPLIKVEKIPKGFSESIDMMFSDENLFLIKSPIFYISYSIEL